MILLEVGAKGNILQGINKTNEVSTIGGSVVFIARVDMARAAERLVVAKRGAFSGGVAQFGHVIPVGCARAFADGDAAAIFISVHQFL